MENRSPLAKSSDFRSYTDKERIAALIYSGTAQQCLTESLYWMRYNSETDGPTDIAEGTASVEGMPDKEPEEEALNAAMRLQNRALALLSFNPRMSAKAVVLNAMERDTDDHDKYVTWVVHLIPEEYNRIAQLEPSLCGYLNYKRYTRLYWRVQGNLLTVSEVI